MYTEFIMAMIPSKCGISNSICAPAIQSSCQDENWRHTCQLDKCFLLKAFNHEFEYIAIYSVEVSVEGDEVNIVVWLLMSEKYHDGFFIHSARIALLQPY